MGLSEAEFYDSTLHHFRLRLNGWQEAKEAEQRTMAEYFRTLAWFTISPHLKKDANLTPSELWPMPHDPQPQNPEPDTEETIARRLYLQKKANGFVFNPGKEALIKKHYTPEWDK